MQNQTVRLPKRRVIRGPATLADLSSTRPFWAAPEADAWGIPRIPFSPEAARLSLELSACSYQLGVDRWLKAGWLDCTFQLENRVLPLRGTPALITPMGREYVRVLRSEWRLVRAKTWMNTFNPIAEVRRARAQADATDTGKTITMAYPLRDGRTLIAVGFLGTSRKLYDWYSNFKFMPAEGMHAGFLELARQYHGHAPMVAFPTLAALMGRESLTMADVLAELKRPDSRFLLWVTGHSQGGAVAQAYVRCLLDEGVPPTRIVGYTFGAPTAALVGAVANPAAYPLYHILNADDLTTRVGAQVRLGVDMLCTPGRDFRLRYYGLRPQEMQLYEQVAPIRDAIDTMETWIHAFIALVQLMEHVRATEGGVLQKAIRERLPQAYGLSERAMQFLHSRFARYMAVLSVRYEAFNGAPPEPERVHAWFTRWEGAYAQLGMERFLDAMRISTAPAHAILPLARGIPETQAAYPAIVRNHADHLLCGVWQPDAPARCLAPDGTQLLPTPAEVNNKA